MQQEETRLRAANELRAAQIMSLDVELSCAFADEHIERCLRYVLASRGRRAALDTSADLRTLVEAEEQDRDQLLGALDAPSLAVRLNHLRAVVEPHDPGARRRWLIRFGIVAGAALLSFVAFALWPKPDGPWRGAYYAFRDFQGSPYMRRDDNIDYNWGRSRPVTALPMDNFTIIWDSCLRLEKETRFVFDWIADNKAEVFVDRTPIKRRADYTFSAGRHHIRVRFQEFSGKASVSLTASVDDGPPAPLPRALLRYPGDEFTDEVKCAP